MLVSKWNVHVHYLWAVLGQFGFGSKYIDFVKTLYSLPTAMVMTGGYKLSQIGLEFYLKWS